MKLSKHEIEDLIARLQKGEIIPEDFKYKLFPVKQKEYELVYGGKMRREDILANEDGVFPVPLQVEKIYNGQREQWKNGWKNIIAFGDNLQFLKTIYENKDPLIKNKIKGKIKLVYIDPPFGTGDDYDGNSGQAAYSAKSKGAEFVEFIRRRLIVAKELLADDGWIMVRQGYHFGHYIKISLDEVFGKHNCINEAIVNRVKKNVTKKGRRNIPNAVDHIYIYRKSESSQFEDVLKKLPQTKKGYWHGMDSQGVSGPRFLIIEGRKFLPPEGTHFKFPQNQADEMYDLGKLRISPNKKGLQYWVDPKDEVNLDSNWTDIPGYTFTTGYPTENSEQLLERVIRATTKKEDIVFDFFAGSGTTAAVAEKLNRRWITCDIGKLSFYTVQKRLINIASSKSLEKPKEQYEDYLHDLHSHIGAKAGKRVYIIAPASYVDFISDYYEIDKVRYFFLKVPYHIIRELHKVQFKKFRQPQSKSNVNDLEDAIGFHFMRQPEVKSEWKEKNGEYHITIKKFLSDFSEEETERDMENFESLAMVLIDKKFDDETFDMDAYYFAEDLLPKKKKKTNEEDESENIKEELKHTNQISLPPIPKIECGKKLMIIYVDIYGNEFKEEFKLK